MKKKLFKIVDMHCTSCSITIDGELEDSQGVKESKTNYAKQVTEVVFDEKRITEHKIIEIIKNSGYTAVSDNS